MNIRYGLLTVFGCFTSENRPHESFAPVDFTFPDMETAKDFAQRGDRVLLIDLDDYVMVTPNRELTDPAYGRPIKAFKLVVAQA